MLSRLKRSWILAAAIVTSPAQAMTVENAQALLVGTWVNTFGGLTWEFTDDFEARFYEGGNAYQAEYEIAELPANIFAIRIKNPDADTDRVMIVHTRNDGAIEVYWQGEKKAIGVFQRYNED